VGSFFLGTFSVYADGYSLTDYETQVTIYPSFDIPARSEDMVGLLFRYQDQNNYYRVSFSRKQGFSRLEKRTNGVFETLSHDGRGFEMNEPIILTICVEGPVILVYYGNEPLFGVIDHDHFQGTIALLTNGVASFDDVTIKENNVGPRVVLGSPNSFTVATTDTDFIYDQIKANAFIINRPQGAGILFTLDKGTADEQKVSVYESSYSADFFGLIQGDHTLEARLVGSNGDPIDCTYCFDHNISIGVGGKYLVAYGDSITSGRGDDFEFDNDSFDGRNLTRGFTPILNGFISDTINQPVTVANEGYVSASSSNGAFRLQSVLERHSGAQIFLIQFGTNDAVSGRESGLGLTVGQSGYSGSFKANMQNIILGVLNAGKEAVLDFACCRFKVDNLKNGENDR
jgi:hypothetical protein